MTILIAAAAVFVLMHLLIAGTRLRGVIVGVIGEGAYAGLFSLGSVAALVWLGMSYGGARGQGEVLWATPDWGKTAQAVIQFVALMLIVPGLLTPNPTAVGQMGAVEKPATGMVRITRHPFLWGVAIWAAGHLLVNGDTPSIILFASVAILSLVGTTSIDLKRKHKLGEAWAGFAAQTSNIPFGAILSGRQSLKLGEIGWWRLALGVIVWFALFHGHQYIFGVSALP